MQTWAERRSTKELMTRTFRNLAVLALLSAILATSASAQNRTYFGGLRNAIAYAYGTPGIAPATPLYVDNPTPTAASGAVTIIVSFGQAVAGDGTAFTPFATNAPVTIGGPTNQETLTPSAVSCNTPTVYDSCTFTVTVTKAHGRGEPISSGTMGLQEAINLQNSAGGGTVLTDAGWYSAGGTKTMVLAVVSTTPKVWIWDTSGVAPVWYGKSGVTSAAYSAVNNDQSFQLTLSAGTATKTLSQTYIVAPNCVGSYISGTATGILKIAPTTTTVVATDSVSEANVVQVTCALQK